MNAFSTDCVVSQITHHILDMMSYLIEIAVPMAALAGLAFFFWTLGRQASHADREKQRKARRLTSSARDAVLGSVGWSHGDSLAADFDCGMVSQERDGHIVVARQARITQETMASL